MIFSPCQLTNTPFVDELGPTGVLDRVIRRCYNPPYKSENRFNSIFQAFY